MVPCITRIHDDSGLGNRTQGKENGESEGGHALGFGNVRVLSLARVPQPGASPAAAEFEKIPRRLRRSGLGFATAAAAPGSRTVSGQMGGRASTMNLDRVLLLQSLVPQNNNCTLPAESSDTIGCAFLKRVHFSSAGSLPASLGAGPQEEGSRVLQ